MRMHERDLKGGDWMAVLTPIPRDMRRMEVLLNTLSFEFAVYEF